MTPPPAASLPPRWRENLSPPAHRLKAGGNAYSYFVRLGKFAFPFVALILAGVVLSRLTGNPVIDHLSSIPLDERSLPGQSELVGARYEGTDMQGRPYTLQAEKAVRVLEEGGATSAATDALTPAEGETVDLVHPQASITMSERMLGLSAATGRFEQATSQLDLTGDVTVYDEEGNALHLRSLLVDFNAQGLHSHEPVEGSGPAGKIKADGLRVEDSGETVIFTGRASVVLPVRGGPAGENQ